MGNVEDLSSAIAILVQDTKNYKLRSFPILGKFYLEICRKYYWGHGKLTLATHNQVDSFFENINHNDGKGAFTLTLFEMTITDCPGFHAPHCTIGDTENWADV
jgi:hypothetical protein